MYKLNNVKYDDIQEVKEAIFNYAINNYDSLMADYNFIKVLINDLENCYSYQDLKDVIAEHFSYEGLTLEKCQHYQINEAGDIEDFYSIDAMKKYLWDGCKYAINDIKKNAKPYSDEKEFYLEYGYELASYYYCLKYLVDAETLQDIEMACNMFIATEVYEVEDE